MTGRPSSARQVPWWVRHRLAPAVASGGRRRLAQATHLHAHVEIGKYVWIGPRFSLEIAGPGTFRVDPGVQFRRGFHCEVAGDGVVEIGSGSVFTADALIQCSTSIRLGKRVMVGQSTLIVDGNHRFRDLDKPMLEQGYDFTPVTIGDDVTITTKCTILADIGERAVIGAGSVVTRPIPAFCVAVGSPARVVEYFGPPELRPPGLDV